MTACFHHGSFESDGLSWAPANVARNVDRHNNIAAVEWLRGAATQLFISCALVSVTDGSYLGWFTGRSRWRLERWIAIVVSLRDDLALAKREKHRDVSFHFVSGRQVHHRNGENSGPFKFHGHFVAVLDHALDLVFLRLQNPAALFIGGAQLRRAANTTVGRDAVRKLLKDDIGTAKIRHGFRGSERSNRLKILVHARNIRGFHRFNSCVKFCADSSLGTSAEPLQCITRRESCSQVSGMSKDIEIGNGYKRYRVVICWLRAGNPGKVFRRIQQVNS